MSSVRAIFLSDVHLGTRACQADRLLDFLVVPVVGIDEVAVLGVLEPGHAAGGSPILDQDLARPGHLFPFHRLDVGGGNPRLMAGTDGLDPRHADRRRRADRP